MYLLVNKIVQAITERERLPPFLNKIVKKLLRYLERYLDIKNAQNVF